MGMRAFRLETPALDAFDHMALDEAVLEAASDFQPDTARCFLRLYRWKDKGLNAVTFGFSQPIAEIESAVRQRRGGVDVPLVRRSTGGGAVYHDGDITFSFVFPWPTLSAPSLIYEQVHLGIQRGLQGRGVSSRIWGAPRAAGGGATLPRECFTAPESKDLTHEDGTKFLGGALRRRKGCGLYQGSMRVEGFEASARSLAEALEEGLSRQWRVVFEPLAPSAEVLATAQRLRLEKFMVDSWNSKR